jgi:hypothetical protein
MSFLSLILKNLLRQRVRTILTVSHLYHRQ